MTITHYFISSRSRQGVLIGLGAILLVYAMSPFWTLWNINHAMQVNNPLRILPYMDWPSISHSIEHQIIIPEATSSDELPGFGHTFAQNFVLNKFNNLSSPANFTKLARSFIISGNKNSFNGWPIHGRLHAHFTSVNRFDAKIDQPGRTPLIVHMEFEHWGWKIIRFDLPADINSGHN